MFYCAGKHIEKWLRQRSRNGRREGRKFAQLGRDVGFWVGKEGDDQNHGRTNHKLRSILRGAEEMTVCNE